MQENIKGHNYTLSNFKDNSAGQTIQFFQTSPGATPEDPLLTVSDGTTNEEVLKMLINRLEYLQAKHPCRENAIVITKLEESLMWLEKRTAGRKARGVEGTNAK